MIQPSLSSERASGVAFLARVVRLLREVEEMNRQLERIEDEMQNALNELAARDSKGYR